MSGQQYVPAAGGEEAIHAAGLTVNKANPVGEAEIRAAVPTARAAAHNVKSRSESTGWQMGEFTGLGISPYQNWLYEKNREWRFTDGTLCVLWCLEFPHSRSDYAKHHRYIASTRRDYNNGKHGAPAPAEPCVGYDRWGAPTMGSVARGPLPTRTPPPAGPVRAMPPAPARPPTSRVVTSARIGLSDEHAVKALGVALHGELRTDPVASDVRRASLATYMDRHVLGPDGFVCASYRACAQSHGGRFFEGQLHHVGRHYDAFIDGRPFRVVVVGQEYGNGPARVTLDARYHDVAVQTGLQKRFRREGMADGRNPHMRGTTSLLRLLLGRDPGDRHEDEFFDVAAGRVHLFDMFALVNFLLCSAIEAGESDTGSKHGRSTPTMHANCARHFVRTIEILEPTLVIVQGKGTLQWLKSSLRRRAQVSDTLSQVSIGAHHTLLASLTRPSAQGASNWADLSRPYLRDVVVPTARAARQILVGA